VRVHYLQHVHFEGIASIEDWARSRGHSLFGTQLFRAADFPARADFDLLVVMGGPMNIYEHEAYPWLEAEKAFLRRAIESGRAVLGICLGAQLLADVLGGPVTRGPQVEIGWFPVKLTPGVNVPVFADFPAEFTVLHWHGDTFAIPPGAAHVASSAGCDHQAFAYDGGRVVGLQFHLEPNPALMRVLVENAGGELIRYRDDPWVQSREELLAPDAPYEMCQALLFSLLDRMQAL
jgi:GMP synthase (glutamine-hydrolysing)